LGAGLPHVLAERLVHGA